MSHIKQYVTENCTFYIPKNPEKYIGKEKKIICRSSWESHMCLWFDHTPAVLQWCSECIAIPYQDPTTPTKNGKPNIRRYYPDFFAVIENKDKTIQRVIIEIKPEKETRPPRRDKRKNPKSALYEAKMWSLNQAKWAAAQRFCAANNLAFKIITEKQIFGRK